MNKVLEYFKQHRKDNPLFQKIRVYGWQNEYDHLLIGSICNYLFEDFLVIENIAPLTNENREGRIKPKFYVTVHDTGDASVIHTAKFWSETVKNEQWEQGKYACSYQYVVGNDGTYHNIPDDEVAWHAGDGTKVDYQLHDSSLTGDNPNPTVTIIDGYYAIDDVKTTIKAPRIYKEKDGQVLLDRQAETTDINDQGVLCRLIDNKYYIGETYYSSGYRLIANRGGNCNSIGIESCINSNSDIYYTWQKTAKLVAHLILDNNLTINDVKQHHYFSGKNCPQTIRMNGLWEHFLELVQFELEIYRFIKEGYKIELIVNNEQILSNGRIKTLNNEIVEYTIRTTKDQLIEEWSSSIKLEEK